MADRWTAQSITSFEDAKHGEWIVMVVKEGWPVDHFYISRWYSSGSQAYGWARNTGIVEKEVSEYSAAHQRLSTPSKTHIDVAGQSWIIAHNTSDEWYGLTSAYGGVLFFAETYSELDGAITKFSIDKKKAGEAPPPAPPVPKPSAITDEALRLSANIATSLDMGVSDLLLVEYAESGLNTTLVNPKSGARGLIQIMKGPAHAIGISDAEYARIPSMAFIEQQRIAEKYFHAMEKSFPNIGTVGYPNALAIYMVVFAPAKIGMSDRLYEKGTRAYDDNAYYDFDHDGVISTADLATALTRRAAEKPFRDVIARVKALGLGGDPNIGTGGTGASFTNPGGSNWFRWAVIGAVGAGAWYFLRDKGGRGGGGERTPHDPERMLVDEGDDE